MNANNERTRLLSELGVKHESLKQLVGELERIAIKYKHIEVQMFLATKAFGDLIQAIKEA